MVVNTQVLVDAKGTCGCLAINLGQIYELNYITRNLRVSTGEVLKSVILNWT